MIERIDIDRLTLRYGDVTALDGLSLSLEGDKIYGLLGRNGSGKTSILSVLAAFRRADAGTVLVGGRELRCEAVVHRLVVVVLAGDRVLELAHALPERPAHLGQPLGPEDEQDDEEQDQDLPDTDAEGHGPNCTTVCARRTRGTLGS